MSSLNSSSLYGNSGRQDRRGNSSYGYNSGGNRSFASFESIYSPSLGPSPYPFSVSGSPENSYANNSGLGMGASSAIGSQGMIRYPTNGSSNDGMMPSYGFNASIPGPANYGLGVGLVGPASPFMGYGTPIPLMPAGYPFAGLAMSAMPGSELYGYDKPRRFHDKGMPIRSPLLEEFRADKTRQWGVAVRLPYNFHAELAEATCRICKATLPNSRPTNLVPGTSSSTYSKRRQQKTSTESLKRSALSSSSCPQMSLQISVSKD